MSPTPALLPVADLYVNIIPILREVEDAPC